MTSTATRLFFGASAAVLYGLTVPSAHAALSFAQNFGISGSGGGQFSLPLGVTLDGTGNVYVADTFNNRIDRFNPANFAGTFATFGSLGAGSGQFSAPGGIAVDIAGNVYVADGSNNRIVRFNPTNFRGNIHHLRQFRERQRAVQQPEGYHYGHRGQCLCG